MKLLFLVALAVSFLTSFFILPSWIKKARRVGLVWEDMNKLSHSKVAGSGGLAVIVGFVLGIFTFIAINTFYFTFDADILKIFALTTSILILAGIGIIDDLLGWKSGGLSKKFRLLMCVFASIPLMVINVGDSVISVPLFGQINVGVFYALLIVPVAITGAATTFNLLAGFNGLEAGQGAILLLALSLVAYFKGISWIAFVGVCMAVALIPFYFKNKFPARVFPGDVLTYPLGGLIAMMAILGNFEKIAVLFFAPYILETFLKLRGGLKMQSFGKPNKEGTLDLRYEKIYGVEHAAIAFLKRIKRKVYERDVVYLIHAFQLLVIVAGLIIFRNQIFPG